MNIMPANSVSYFGTSLQNYEKKLLKPKYFIPAFIPFFIPTFGPVVIEVTLLPAIVAGLTEAFSRGANKSRLHELNNLPKDFACYQWHPESTHVHTLTLGDLPYPKKLKIANAANDVLNAFGEIICPDRQTFFKKYVEARDQFYDTINSEYKGCKEDYYNIATREAIRQAWFKCDYEHDFNEALNKVNEVIHIREKSKNLLYSRLPLDLITAKIAVHYLKDEIDEAKDSLKKLIAGSYVGSKSDQEYLDFVSQQLHILAMEGYHKKGDLDLDDPCDLMALIAFNYLNVAYYNRTLKGDFHAGKFIEELLKALYDNLKLLKNTDSWHLVPHGLAAGFDPQNFNSINLKVLKALIKDFIPSIMPIENLSALFNSNFNSAKIFMNYKAFEYCVKNYVKSFIPNLKKAQQALKDQASHYPDPSLYIINEGANSNCEVVIFDTMQLTCLDSKSHFDDLGAKTQDHNVCVIHHRYKSSRNYFYSCQDQELKNQKATYLLYEELLKRLNKSSCQKCILSCHSYGLEIVQKVLKMLPEHLLTKLELAVFSPTFFVSDLNKVKIVYYQDIKDSFSEIALNLCLQKQEQSIYYLNDTLDMQEKEANLDLVYKNKLISLLL